MPSFDIVSKVDQHEVRNAVEQANREIATRFDFKGSDARIELGENKLTVFADDEFKVGQARDILFLKLAKRGVDIASMDAGKVEPIGGDKARQAIAIREGIDAELARKIVRLVKDAKLKVQTAIQGDELRVTGKKRDDLQSAIALLRQQELGQPLQYVNFRD